MKDFIIWYTFEGCEDYTIVKANSEADAVFAFNLDYCGCIITDCHIVE